MAESLSFNIGANTQGFQDGINGMLGKLAGLVAAFVSAQAVIEAFGAAIDMGGRLNDLSTRTGETAGNLAILERAFDNASVGAEKVGPAINKLQKELSAAASGSDSAVAAFAQLGLTWQDLQDKSPTEQLQLIGERLSGINDPALRSATAMALFGRSGGEMLPVLINFGAEIEEAKRQLGSLPQLLDASAGSVDFLGDNLHAIRSKLTEMAYGFLSEVLPAVNMFAEKLAGIDAAGLGVGLADLLVGAFVNPMKAAELLGETLLLGAKNYSNLLLSAADYFYELMRKTLEGMGFSLPSFSSGLIDAAINFGQGMFDALSMAANLITSITLPLGPVGSLLGGAIQLGLSEASKSLEGLKTLADNAWTTATDFGVKMVNSFTDAYGNTQFIVKDFSNAEGSTVRIKSLFAGLQDDARAAMDEFTTTELAEGRTTTGDTVDPLIQQLINENLVKQKPALGGGGGSGGGGGGMTQKQIDQAITNALNNISGINPNQAIGQSASAQRSKELKDQLQDLVALGKGDTAKADAIRQSIATHESIALGTNLTATDRDAAWDWAKANMNADWADGLKVDQLADMAEQNILDGKTQAIRDRQQQEKDKQDEQTKDGGGAKDQQKPVSTLSIQQQLLALMQKIEPRIPIANLA